MDNIYPAVGDSFKSGFVTLVGRPNAGKSIPHTFPAS